jgi:CBS-domain-containing membrane protein
MRHYAPLHSLSLATKGVCLLVEAAPNRVTMDSPALDVMTDLAHVAAATIDAAATLKAANDFMIARGVRSLFVVNAERRVVGLVTVADVLGEKPLRVSQTRGVKRSDLLATDVMTATDNVTAMTIEDVRNAKVGHIVASLQQAGRQHGLVVETNAAGVARICGIFSASQIARQLGEAVHITEVAHTFAEVEQALGA